MCVCVCADSIGGSCGRSVWAGRVGGSRGCAVLVGHVGVPSGWDVRAGGRTTGSRGFRVERVRVGRVGGRRGPFDLTGRRAERAGKCDKEEEMFVAGLLMRYGQSLPCQSPPC